MQRVCRLNHSLVRIARRAGWLAFTLAFTWIASAQDASAPRWIESGIRDKLSGLRALTVLLSETPPAAMKKGPPDLEMPRYGTFKTGPVDSRVTHSVVLALRDGLPARMFVDANGDGDLTDEPAVEWTAEEASPIGAREATLYARTKVNLTADGKRKGLLVFYCRRAEVTNPAPPLRYLSYHTDCGVTGHVTIDGKNVAFAMSDLMGEGEFASAYEPRNAPGLWLDRNGNGEPDRGETSDASQPFVFKGKWWAIGHLAPDGSFQAEAATKPEPRRGWSAPDLSPGRKAPTFFARTTEGQEVRFPDDYQGKLVLVHFWATSSDRCVAEIPNWVKAYEKYHMLGLEVIGISLDREGRGELLEDFTKRERMSWPQVYNGRGEDGGLARLLGIRIIPRVLLLDADTALVVANGDIRGEALALAIEKALAARKR